MAILSPERIHTLLEPYLAARVNCDEKRQVYDNKEIIAKLDVYLDLLVKWNARTNLTAIREPEEMVRRHFGESLFTGAALRSQLPETTELLDFGSGAGFPGLPIQLWMPAWRVTLAESQGKKAAFLREAVRTLGLSTEVWANRVEALPVARMFDCVALRAVDNMDAAIKAAAGRVKSGGLMAILGGADRPSELATWSTTTVQIPASQSRYLHILVAP